MQDITWKFFTQTGNIETYLLIKELETGKENNDLEKSENAQSMSESEQ